MKNDQVCEILLHICLYETVETVHLGEREWKGRVGDMCHGAKTGCVCCRQDLLYRLPNVGGEGKIDDHFRSWWSYCSGLW